MKAYIRVKGGWSTLTGIATEDILEACCSALDPKREHRRAFQEERWDGRVRLYKNNSFPSGLTDTVAEYVENLGKEVQIIGRAGMGVLDIDEFDRDILNGITLWDHQYEACIEMLLNQCCCIKSPTASGKTEMMAAVAKFFWEQLQWRSLIMVPDKGLLTDTVKRLRGYYGDEIHVGQCGDQIKEPGDITVATPQTLIGYKPRRRKGKFIAANPKLRALLFGTEVVFADECHHSSSPTWYDLLLTCKAKRRYGLSGTPIKDDVLKDLKFKAATGSVKLAIPYQRLRDAGLVTEPRIVMVAADNASGPELPVTLYRQWDAGEQTFVSRRRSLPYKKAYVRGVVENDYHNAAVILATQWCVDHGRSTLVLCRRKDQWRTLKEMLGETGIEFGALWGAHETDERDFVKNQFRDGGIQALLATTIFDEGKDVKAISAIVLAEGVKVQTNCVQRVGRGMRPAGGHDDLWVVDIVPVCHDKLLEHGLERAKAWEAEGYETVMVDEWPAPGDDSFDYEKLLPFLDWDAA